MPVTLNIIESTTELGQEVVTITLASASEPGPAGPGVPTGGTDGQVLTKTSATDYATAWEDPTGAGGGGAPDDVDYLVGTASGDLSAEIVVGTSPGGELGGTWASPTVDATHSGSSHAGIQAAAEATAASALAAHEADTTSIHGIANTANLYSVGGTDVAIADGGTGASTAAGARANLDLEPGTDFPALSTFNDHSARHENGGGDELSVAGLSGLLADAQTPLSHNHAGEDITSGTVADARIAATIARDSEVATEIADQKRVVEVLVTDPNGDDLATGNGQAHAFVPLLLNGHNLVAAHAGVTTVSSSGDISVMIHNVTQAADMLSAAIVIQANEKTSYTGTAGTIDTGNDDVATGDELRVDVDGAGTGAKGLAVILTFEAP